MQLTASGGSGAGYFFSATNLPAWLFLSSTGTLTGTPPATTGSPFHFTITAFDNNGGAANHAYSLTVVA